MTDERRPLTSPFTDAEIAGEFDFDAPEVKEELYESPIESLPTVTWLGKIQGEQKWGYWTTGRESFEEKPMGWEPHEVRFGSNPNNPLTPVYYTYRARLCPIAVRKRWVVDGTDGNMYFYPWFTRKADRVEGKPTGQIQVLVRFPDDDVPRMLALRGFTKNVCWSNDPHSQRGIAEFPTGVEQILIDYAETASQVLRERRGFTGTLPWLCAWWVDLTPWIEEKDGRRRAAIVDVGHGTYMNPFVADMQVGDKDEGPAGHPILTSRFVGQTLFDEFQEFRREYGLDWEAEWSEVSSQAMETEYGTDDIADEPYGDEEDEIPF